MNRNRLDPPGGFGDGGKTGSRLRYRMTGEKRMQVDRLISRIPAATCDQDVMNYALSVLDWAVEQREHGRSIAALEGRNAAYQLSFKPLDDIPPKSTA
jgi:hypothetical protein